MPKLRVATVWFSGCSGCHMSFLDLDERLLEFAERADLVFSPIADVKEFPENVDVVLIEGAVGNTAHLHELLEIRRRAKILVALGDCAITANVPSLRNPLPREEVLHTVYGKDDPPGLEEGAVPKLLPHALPLHAVVPVDYFLPGCPPPAERIWKLLRPILLGQRPELSGPDLKFG
ncbi:MAG: NADP oxidoreductase [Candidatus Bipolaricaulota bacterium]|nr:NADP oxidoreductase [Candidatus Bipolaricaulota bacterium]MDW8126456.1 NADP oxidoreductase [Candidatus Bipolaricaulota bacterium]